MRDILSYMGNTPLVKIENIYGKKWGNIYLKLEEFNPGGSIKSRVGLQMLVDAEQDGRLHKGIKLIEPTGGNTGLGLAVASAIKGYDLTLVIPDNFSQEKIKTLKKYNANILLSDHSTGPGSHVRLCQSILNENKDYYCLDQFSNPSNPKAHYLTTSQEIISQLNEPIDVFIAGIGSGGTIMGVGKRLKEINPKVKVIGVQPKGCDFINGVFVPHKIEAISVGIISSFIDFDIIDDMMSVDYDEVNDLREYLSRKQGIFVGISSGANVLAALKLSLEYSSKQNIVTVAPDSGRSYL